MNSKAIVRTAAMLAALCLSVPVFAKPFVKTISITQPAKVGQVTLKAGAYQLSIDGNKVTVQRGKDQVAQSEGRWEDRSAKSDYDAVLLGENGQVKEVRFAGQKRVFVFSE
ncbi:MAG: hypothetical protein JSS69_01420 [Acidobacteria bacterium]|nr:hypothetical protein [Acidobacteriota bacterium]MBS1864553.1 hypothetical protein [Acidobacteriota bacterium]